MIVYSSLHATCCSTDLRQNEVVETGPYGRLIDDKLWSDRDQYFARPGASEACVSHRAMGTNDQQLL